MPTMQERVERLAAVAMARFPRRLVEDLRTFAECATLEMPNVAPDRLAELQDLATTLADELDEAILDRTI